MLALSPSMTSVERGLEAAFDAAYRAHAPSVYRLCLRYSGGRVGWAEDATQDTFIKLLERLPKLSDREALGGWLYRVATNLCVSKLRQERSLVGRIRRLVQPQETPSLEAYLELHTRARSALEAMRALPPREHAVMSMKLFDDMRQREIARTLGLSEGYVSKLIKRASLKLRDQGWEIDND